MRSVLIAAGVVALAAATLVVLHNADSADDTSAGTAAPAVTAAPVSSPTAADASAIRLDGDPLACRDWGFVRGDPPSESFPPPLPPTGAVIQADQVTAMTVCERDFLPLEASSGKAVRELHVTDPAQAARIITAANQPRQPWTGACPAIGYGPSDQVLVRYGAHGVDRVGFAYGACGITIGSSLSTRDAAGIAPGYLGTLVPIADAPTSTLSDRDAPCLLQMPASGRGTPARPPFVARATRSVTICRYGSHNGKLIDQETLAPAAYDQLEQWLAGLPRKRTDCQATSQQVHDVLLVV